MDQPVFADGAVAVAHGRILDVGRVDTLTARHAGAIVHDAGDVVLLPGLINAHTHLELSMCNSEQQSPDFVDWILSMRSNLGPRPDFASAASDGAQQSLGFGVTCVGDISQQAHLTRAALHDGLLRVVSFGEALGIGTGRAKFADLLARALDPSESSEFLHIGVSPHAPYSVDERDFRTAVALAGTRGLPVCTHLGEQFAEREFLSRRTGPFRTLLETIGAWDDDVRTFDGSPMRFARSVGLLSSRALLAHVNDCDDDDLDVLGAGDASVVWCPRTHAYFGHAPHRWRDMIARGVNVAVGTDSLASSPDLNVVDDLRLIHRQNPEVRAELFWSMITTRAARALWSDDRIGSLSVGKYADVVAFPVTSSAPLEEILLTNVLPSAVWVAGNHVPKSGG